MPDTNLTPETLALLAAALIIGGVIGWVLFRAVGRAGLLAELAQAHQQADALSDQLTATEASLSHLELEYAEQREKLAAAQAEIAHLKGQRTAEQSGFEQRLKDMAEIRATLDKDVKAVTDAALKSSQEHFMGLAKQMFEQERAVNKAELSKAREAMDHQLKPVQDTLTQYQTRLSQFEKDSQAGLHRVSQEIRHVAELHQRVERETAKLTNALRAAPKTRGRWGEHQLRNVLELAGMAEHVDFDTEKSVTDDSGTRQRPDAIIHIPGGRHIIVDAKTSMSAYLDAVEATDEATRDQLLVKHAQELRTHVKQLGSKQYWQAIGQKMGETTDMVAMFVPGDNFYAAAVERDPNLFSDALDNRVLIVTPTTLFAVAKAIAYGWQQASISDNARQAAELGQKLYSQLITTGNHINSVGKAINATVERYNKFVGSLESRTLVTARKFNDLEGVQTSDPMTELTPIDETARALTRGRDLIIDEPSEFDQK